MNLRALLLTMLQNQMTSLPEMKSNRRMIDSMQRDTPDTDTGPVPSPREAFAMGRGGPGIMEGPQIPSPHVISDAANIGKQTVDGVSPSFSEQTRNNQPAAQVSPEEKQLRERVKMALIQKQIAQAVAGGKVATDNSQSFEQGMNNRLNTLNQQGKAYAYMHPTDNQFEKLITEDDIARNYPNKKKQGSTIQDATVPVRRRSPNGPSWDDPR